jgi:hypothetical protein
MLHIARVALFLIVVHCGSAYLSSPVTVHLRTPALALRKSHDQCRPTSRFLTKLNATRPDKQIKRNSEDGMKSSLFTFTEMAEVLNGRLAMTFFAVGIYEEFVTGKSIIEQAGLGDHGEQLSALKIACVFGSLALISFITKTVTKATENDA